MSSLFYFYINYVAEDKKGGYVGTDKSHMTEEQKHYERGMQYLSMPVNKGGQQTIVELYTELQKAYSEVVAQRAHAFREARDYADISHGKDVEAADAAFAAWLEENAFAWRNRVQAAYMNWVVSGKKEEVEFWFAIVDQETAMSRIELSKVRRPSLWYLIHHLISL